MAGVVMGAVRRLVLGLALACCVLAMHGFQASSSPVDISGLAMIGNGHGSASGIGHSAPRPSDSEEPRDTRHDHPGGQMCLAILMLISLVAMLLDALRRYRYALVLPRCPNRPEPWPGSRSPPTHSIFQLAVLRL